MQGMRMFASHGIIHSPFVAPEDLDFEVFNELNRPKPVEGGRKNGPELTFDKNMPFKSVYAEDIDIRDLIRNFHQEPPREENAKF